MPTKMISKALTGVMGAALLATPAFAGGNCGAGGCAVPVQVMDSYAPEFGPMTVRNQNPMGHLRSVNFQRAPNVSITRVHGMMPTAALSDAPSGFTNGCHPTSTTYCRQDAGVPVQVEMRRQAPAPVPLSLYSPPAPVQVVEEPRVVAIGGGYDPSKFAPRTYGDATFVPGIAHVPTSIVDRDPVRAQQVLDSGRTVSQPVLGRDTFGGTVPNPGMLRQQGYNVTLPGTYRGQVQRTVTLPGTYRGQTQRMMPAPQMRAPGLMNTQGLVLGAPRPGPSFGQPGAPVLQQNGPMAGSYGSSVGADGTYWEKVSGPTAFGDTIATSVICKRQLPTQTVRPVVNVPYPVPVQVAPQPGCAPVPHGLGQYEGGHKGAGRYGHSEQGRWVH